MINNLEDFILVVKEYQNPSLKDEKRRELDKELRILERNPSLYEIALNGLQSI